MAVEVENASVRGMLDTRKFFAKRVEEVCNCPLYKFQGQKSTGGPPFSSKASSAQSSATGELWLSLIPNYQVQFKIVGTTMPVNRTVNLSIVEENTSHGAYTLQQRNIKPTRCHHYTNLTTDQLIHVHPITNLLNISATICSYGALSSTL